MALQYNVTQCNTCFINSHQELQDTNRTFKQLDVYPIPVRRYVIEECVDASRDKSWSKWLTISALCSLQSLLHISICVVCNAHLITLNESPLTRSFPWVSVPLTQYLKKRTNLCKMSWLGCQRCWFRYLWWYHGQVMTRPAVVPGRFVGNLRWSHICLTAEHLSDGGKLSFERLNIDIRDPQRVDRIPDV